MNRIIEQLEEIINENNNILPHVYFNHFIPLYYELPSGNNIKELKEEVKELRSKAVYNMRHIDELNLKIAHERKLRLELIKKISKIIEGYV